MSRHLVKIPNPHAHFSRSIVGETLGGKGEEGQRARARERERERGGREREGAGARAGGGL